MASSKMFALARKSAVGRRSMSRGDFVGPKHATKTKEIVDTDTSFDFHLWIQANSLRNCQG